MNTEELAGLIKTRRSIRVWQDKPVPEGLLWQAVELATWAPNGANAQNWHFYIVLNRDLIKSIADVVAQGMRLMASWFQQQGAAAFPLPRENLLAKAPAMIAVGIWRREYPREKVLAERAKTDEKAAEMLQWGSVLNLRLQSVSAAIAYLLLVLHQMGLGATWMTGPLSVAKGEVEKILNVPSDMDIVAIIPVGYPAESPTRERRPVSEVCEVVR